MAVNASAPVDEASLAWTTVVQDMRKAALTVAEVGYWEAPPGFMVYWAINTVNWKFYVGETVNFMRRVRGHWNVSGEEGGPPLRRALRKYGIRAFVSVPIEYFNYEADMHAAEIRMIAQYKSQHADIEYNVANGGDGIGREGAKAVHARPEFRANFLASYPARAIKAAETRRRNLARYNGVC